MSAIKGENTNPEKVLFESLKARGIRFRKHYKILGSPDIVLPKLGISLFVDGDFWHGYDYNKRKSALPPYWVAKIKRNIDRDKKYSKALKKDGWVVLRFWEHDIIKDPDKVVDKIKVCINNQNNKVKSIRVRKVKI